MWGGSKYYNEEAYVKAIKCYKKAIRVNKLNEKAHRSIINSYIADEKYSFKNLYEYGLISDYVSDRQGIVIYKLEEEF